MHAIANARMTRALRSVSSEKGRDPREFALIAYGGAGPVHAAGLAEELGCTTVLVPALAGLFSSLGLLFARPEFHDVHSCHLDARTVAPAELGAVFDELQARIAPSLDGAPSSGFGAPSSATAARPGRSRSSWAPARVDAEALTALIAGFEDEHERLYGVRGEEGSPIEIRALRLARPRPVAAPSTGWRSPTREPRRAAEAAPLRRRGRSEDVRSGAAPRSASSAEPGPLLVDEYDTTVVVRRGWTVRRDPATETLVLERDV